MQEVSKDIFYKTIENWESVPFTQTEGLICMQSGGDVSKVLFFLDDNIGCAAHVKRFLGLTMLMVDSECMRYKQNKPSTISHFYEALRQTGVDIIEVNSRRVYEADYEIGMRQAGYMRPVGSFSFELTNIIDLTKPLTFNENWKRNLKHSEGLGLRLERIEQPTDSDLEDFMSLYREMCAQKQLTMPFTKTSLRILLTDSHFHLCFISEDNKRLSAIIYHQSRTHCGLLYAATSQEGNDRRAGFQLYKLLLTRLQQEGIETFDMEKMGASVHSTNAVFLFKQGIKGQLLPLCGEWSWYKRSWMGVGIYFVKKYLWKKVQA